MDDILSKEEIEQLLSLKEEDIKEPDDEEYSYIFSEEIANKIKAIEERKKQEKKPK